MDWTHTILGPEPYTGAMVMLILIVIEGALSTKQEGANAVAPRETGFTGPSPADLNQQILARKYFDLGTSAFALLAFTLPVCVHLIRTRAIASQSRPI